MIPKAWRRGEVAVIGLGRSGVAAAKFLTREGIVVYASDVSEAASTREAASALRERGATVDVGLHDLDRISQAVAVVASPGVPPDAPPLRAARDAGVQVFAELDLAAMVLERSKLIVVTGTNGKTTTTALISHLLEHAGVPTAAAGNIGKPLIEIAWDAEAPAWVVVEASSFQLHDAPHLRPTVGVVTNLSPDHLDRYSSAAAYYNDKRQLFRNAVAQSVWILNGDDAAVLRLPAGAPGIRRRFSLRSPDDAWYDRLQKRLMLGGGRELLERSRLPLLGDHNVANALAASLAAAAVGLEPPVIGEGLATFRAIAHRLEPVHDADGVLWINDSKATNLASTEVALRAMTRPYVLIAGGRSKGDSYAKLAPLLPDRCRGVVAYGEARERITHDLAGVVCVESLEAFDEAVMRAGELAQSGDVVLLSPGAASFDQFGNFEERGDAFRRVAQGQ